MQLAYISNLRGNCLKLGITSHLTCAIRNGYPRFYAMMTNSVYVNCLMQVILMIIDQLDLLSNRVKRHYHLLDIPWTSVCRLPP